MPRCAAILQPGGLADEDFGCAGGCAADVDAGGEFAVVNADAADGVPFFPLCVVDSDVVDTGGDEVGGLCCALADVVELAVGNVNIGGGCRAAGG